MQTTKRLNEILVKPQAAAVASAMLLFAALSSGCMHSSQPPSAPPPPQVTVAYPKSDKVTDFEEFNGHTEAEFSDTVQAMVSGQLEKVLFTEGSMVAANQPLFEIDQQPFQAAYDQTAANVALAMANLRRLEANLKRADALLPTKAISQESYDQAVGDRDVAAATVKSAEAAMHAADVNLKYTIVHAKFAGRIGRRMIDPGNVVKEKDTVLTTLVSTERMYIYFDVDERTAIHIRKLIQEGKVSSTDKSSITINYGLADEEGYPRTADVNFVDNQINMSTGTWRLRALIEKPDSCLLPNMFLRVRVPIGKPYETLLVPELAIGSDQGQQFLYVVDNDKKAIYRQVKCGPLREGMRAINAGLNLKERFVVSGLQRIQHAGQEVDPKEETPKDDGKKKQEMTAGPTPAKIAEK